MTNAYATAVANAAGRTPGAPDRARDAGGVRQRLVIAGLGMAGHKLLERLVEIGALASFDVLAIGEEPYAAYDRVHLTGYLAHREAARLELAPRDWYAAHGVRLVTGDPVVSIDRERRQVRTASGLRAPYDRLVLATGSSAWMPPIEGAAEAGVLVYRTIEDLERIRVRAAQVRTAIVIGGGLLGLEAARALQELGLAVSIVETAPHLLSRQLDSAGGRLLEERVRSLGIATYAGLSPVRVVRAAAALRLEFRDESPALEAGLIVAAAGIRPRDELARHAELSVGSGQGGIVVDDTLATSDPLIHAIGECAWHRGNVIGLAAPGYRMAEVLAQRLAGGQATYEGADTSTRLKLLGADVSALGDHAQPGSVLAWSGDGVYRQITLKDGRIAGASSVGPWPELGFIQEAIRKRRRVWPWQAKRFVRTGSLRKRPEAPPVAAWPASAVVCNCMGITRGELAQARAAGCATVESLAACTKASTLCGSCRPLLAELVGAPAAPARKHRGLVIAAAMAAVLCAAILAVRATPLAENIQAESVFDTLYRSAVWRQATGFTLLGITLAAAVLSLRKRWRRFSKGSYVTWRVIHAALGVLALAALAAHTGLRMGSNLNFALMTCFLAVSGAGAAAGATAESRGRRWTFWLHVATVWPLPVLLGFHILAAYYF